MLHPRKIASVMITPLPPHNDHFRLSPRRPVLRAEVPLYHED